MCPKTTLSTSKVLSTLNTYTIIKRSKVKENANTKSLQAENEAMCKLCGISCTQ